MVLIPAGNLEIGSVNAFYIDTYPVTNLEYQQFLVENPQWQKSHLKDRFHDGDYLNIGMAIPTPKEKRITLLSTSVGLRRWLTLCGQGSDSLQKLNGNTLHAAGLRIRTIRGVIRAILPKRTMIEKSEIPPLWVSIHLTATACMI